MAQHNVKIIWTDQETRQYVYEYNADEFEMNENLSWPRPKKGETERQPMSLLRAAIRFKGNVTRKGPQ